MSTYDVLCVCLIHGSREADRGEEGRRHIVSLRNSLLFDAAVTLHPVDVILKNKSTI